MFNNKIPVPEGFCVTAQAYEKFIELNGIKDEIKNLLDIDIENTNQLQDASEKIKKLILKSQMPIDIKNDIENAYSNINDFVAIRSSATAEDLPTASFAGQQETYLNVKGTEDVVKHVQKCWASLFTSRAIYYRVTNKFDHMKVLISVVVQKMVNSTSAGVMFTVHPVTNDRNEIIIEGNFGLGELVVNGSVTPDSYIVTKKPLEIKDIYVGDKSKAMYRNEEGKNYEKILDEESNKQVLNDKQILELAKLGILIENHYNFPQDIEWAFEDDKLYITQSRPITTLK
ncbi:MAG: PEP/pyruvate-binding domain-containing protein, partial [Candidatus Woesearchaeota archaeon]